MVELPHELWREIVQYLPPAKLYQMRVLNRHLWNIALDQVYREGRVHYPEDRKTEDFVRRLKHCPAQVEARLRQLYLRPHVYGAAIQSDKLSKKAKDDAREATFILESLAKLKALSELDLQCCWTDVYSNFQGTFPYLKSAFRTYSNSVQTLRLTIPLEAYKDMDFRAITLCNLRHLQVSIFTCYTTSDPNIIESNFLAPFINNHTETLESLSVTSIHNRFNFPINPLFTKLGSFPRLSQLELGFFYISPAQTGLGGVETFLGRHSKQIQQLSITAESQLGVGAANLNLESLLSQPAFTMRLPALHSLSLSFSGFGRSPSVEPVRHIAGYVSRYKSTLRSFSLAGKSLSLDETKALTSALQGGPLESMSFIAQYFGPDLLSHLSSKLPDLLHLRIRMERWVGKGWTGTEPTYPFSLISTYVDNFIRDMANESYVSWKLQRLEMAVGGPSEDKLQKCLSALTGALPNVRSFNGLGREEFASGAPFRPPIRKFQ